MRAPDARPGDVVLCEDDGQYYQAPDGGGAGGWSVMQPIGFMSEGPESTAPDGELTLVARDGRPAADHPAG
jgi:hypothetical protein